MSAANSALIRRFIDEALNQKNLAVADEIVAEDFIELDPLSGQSQGRQGLKDVLAGLFSGFPDMNWVVEEQIAEGNKVMTRFTWMGTH
jgi:predicted ester cyclase